MELQNLDQQLKLAIQNHQILVARMKSDPKNGSLQKQLHELQAQIKSLSEKQKQVVQQLRKDLEIKQKQAAIVTSSASITTALQKNNTNLIKVLPQCAPLSLTTKRTEVRSTKGITVSAAIILPNKVNSSTASVITSNGSSHARPPFATTATNSASTTTSAFILRAVNSPTTLSAHLSSPIRVPQYPPSVGRGNLLTANSQRSTLSVKKESSSQNILQPVAPHPPVISPHVSVVSLSSNKETSPEQSQTTSDLQKGQKDKPSNVDSMKTNFMAALGLITHGMLTELQSRRSERKRRTTANPQFSYSNWDNADKKCNTNYLSGTMPSGFKRPRGRPRMGSSTTPTSSRPSTPEDIYRSCPPNGLTLTQNLRNGALLKEPDFCMLCRERGELDLVCEICSKACHRTCLNSHLKAGDVGFETPWICSNCVSVKKTNQELSRSLSVVQTYQTHKAAKLEEKRKLVKRSIDLKREQNQLEQRAKQLSEAISKNVQRRNDIMAKTKDTVECIDRIKNAIRVFRAS